VAFTDEIATAADPELRWGSTSRSAKKAESSVSPTDLSDTLPNWQSFDVNSYADYLKSVSALQGKVFGDPTKMRPVLLSSSTLATTLKPAKGTTITRAGAMPASDVHQHRIRALISKLEP
jgi:hypothetical protein